MKKLLKLSVLLGTGLVTLASLAWDMGEPIVTYWAGPRITDESLKLLKEGGFNLVWASSKADLDLIAKWGLRAIFWCDSSGIKPNAKGNIDPNKCKEFKQRIESLKDHPALYIYYHDDEPPASRFEGLAAGSRIVRTVDPNHPTWVNLLPTYANNKQLGLDGEIISAYREHVRLFLETYDPAFVSYDHYQFNNGWDTSNYFLNLSIVQQASAARDIPFMNGVQACSWGPEQNLASPAEPRIPGPDEMRFLVYTTLAYGAQGIYYYVYSFPRHRGSIVSQDGVPDAKYYELSKLNPIFVATAKQLRGYRFMGAYFKGYCPRGGTPYSPNAILDFADGMKSEPLPERKELTDSILVSRFDSLNRPTRLMVVNLDYRKERSLDISAPFDVARFDPNTGKWMPLGKKFTLDLAKGEGTLLQVGNCQLSGLLAGVPENQFVFISPRGEWKATTNCGPQVAAFSGRFVNAKDVAKAEAFVTSLGTFEFYVNGALVSSEEDGNRSDYLRPGATDPKLRRSYMAYDITGLVKKEHGAENGLSAFVAASWFCDSIGGRPGVKPALAAEVRVEYSDGSVQTFRTDEKWGASFDTPYIRAGIYEGEKFDARLRRSAAECAGDACAEINTNFVGVTSPAEGPGVSLRRDIAIVPCEMYKYNGADGVAKDVFGRIRKTGTFRPGEPIQLNVGETLVIDFGQNAAAVPEIVASAANGVTMTFRGAEMLNDANGERSRGNDGPAGSIYRENYRALKDDGALVEYVFAGSGRERYLPTFTFMGYRYADIKATGPLTIWSIRSIPVTSIRKSLERGTVTTGDVSVNRLISNVRWGQYSNYVSIPTDCPQRDERLGWTADTQVFTAAAYRNADVYGFLTKWMTDMRDSAGQDKYGRFPGVAPSQRWDSCGRGRLGWADAGVIVPWTSWKMTGDKSIVEKNWDAMVKFVDFQQKTKYRTAEAADGNYQWADWVSFEKYESASGRGWGPGKKLLPETAVYWNYLAGCYWYWNATRMAEMARLLGKADAAEKYEKMSAEAHGYVKGEFFKDGGRLPAFLRDMQTPHLFALHFGFYDNPEVKKEAIAQLLKNIEDHGGCLQTGFLGTSILMDTLTYDVGRPDVAYSLLLQHKFPSWLYSVDQGATTIWERWNSYTKEKGFGPVGMNSFNHYAYGAVLDWICGTAAGLRPGKDGGFDKSFTLAPMPDKRLGSIEATYRTGKGTIRSAWKYLENGSVEYTFFVPDGIEADVTIGGEKRKWKHGSNKIVTNPIP